MYFRDRRKLHYKSAENYCFLHFYNVIIVCCLIVCVDYFNIA